MPIIWKGYKGPLAQEVQRRLQQLDLYAGELDGHYGEQTVKAMARFQREICRMPVGKGLGGAGKCDGMTLAALVAYTS